MKIEIEIPDAVYEFIESLFGDNSKGVVEKIIVDELSGIISDTKKELLC